MDPSLLGGMLTGCTEECAADQQRFCCCSRRRIGRQACEAYGGGASVDSSSVADLLGLYRSPNR